MRDNYICLGIYIFDLLYFREMYDMFCKKKKRFILRRKLLNVDVKENKF